METSGSFAMGVSGQMSTGIYYGLKMCLALVASVSLYVFTYVCAHVCMCSVYRCMWKRLT